MLVALTRGLTQQVLKQHQCLSHWRADFIGDQYWVVQEPRHCAAVCILVAGDMSVLVLKVVGDVVEVDCDCLLQLVCDSLDSDLNKFAATLARLMSLLLNLHLVDEILLRWLVNLARN